MIVARLARVPLVCVFPVVRGSALVHSQLIGTNWHVCNIDQTANSGEHF